MPTSARVVVTPGDGSLQIETITLPDPGPHEVLVRTIATGICHSQLTDMKMSAAMGQPMTLGHEATGEVIGVGGAVTSVAVGDRVFVTWLPRDGGPLSRRPGTPVLARAAGPDATCHNVFTWADHLVCDELYVVPFPADLPLDVTSIIGCAVMTGAGAALNTSDVQAGQSVAVFGVGGVGISAIVAAAARGANPIIAVDLDDAKLEWAKRQGATHGINARTVDAVQAIHEITADPGRFTIFGTPVSGVHHAFDCIGGDVVVKQLLPSLINQPYATTERGTAVLVGIVTLPALEVSPGDLIVNEKRLVGCIGGSSVPSRDFPIFCDWVRNGRLDLDAIVTRRFVLDDIAEAAAALDRGEITGRSIITF
jgi:Zn-dependent alcohol dehydrogenase